MGAEQSRELDGLVAPLEARSPNVAHSGQTQNVLQALARQEAEATSARYHDRAARLSAAIDDFNLMPMAMPTAVPTAVPVAARPAAEAVVLARAQPTAVSTV